MRRFIGVGLVSAVWLMTNGCSSASYQVMKQGTWKIGAASQPVEPVILQTVSSEAPGGKAAIVVVYFSADEPPIVEAKGDSSALVEATATAGRKAFDLAVKFAKSGVTP
jgi:hypothetical protein